MTKRYVGLMSGTSMDGIDAAVVSFADANVVIHATMTCSYPETLRDELRAAILEPLDVQLDPTGDLDRRVGECFRDAALAVVQKAGLRCTDIEAIGSHGQTLRHQPDADPPFTLQIGDARRIASGTKVTTVANFRAADMAVGGQGAPLVPPFHHWLFVSPDRNRVVANIGGIANITHLPAAGGNVTGFDTGPGNGLMDRWSEKHLNQAFDDRGRWAASGTVIDQLLEEFCEDSYFHLPPPKSTGFEYFNASWLQQFDTDRYEPGDVQATLCELTATCIANSITNSAGKVDEVFVCGGGAHNRELMRRLARNLPDTALDSTRAVGLDPEWVEATAFAWLAMRTVNGETGNLPSVTGASHAVILGVLHYP